MIVSLVLASLTIALADDLETSPYGDIQTGVLDKTQPILAIKVHEKSPKDTPGDEKLRIKFYNNTDKPVNVVEQNVFVDFNFAVKGTDGTVLAANQKGSKIKQNRDAWIHAPITLAPGQFTVYDVNLSKFYDLQPGQTYSVQVSRYVRFGDGPISKVQSNILQFAVPQ
jgi:hypothetical protein